MRELEFQVTDQGAFARQALAGATAAALLGATSRGIFLQIAGRRVIFLSSEHFRGPLTLNLDRPLLEGDQIDRSQTVEIHPACLIFPSNRIVIQTGGAREWLVPPRPPGRYAASECRQRFRAAGQIITRQRSGGTIPLLAGLLGLDPPAASSRPLPVSWPEINPLVESLKFFDEHALLSELDRWIGLGSGLTPSGDDLITGLLLTLHRYSDWIRARWDPTCLAKAVTELAYSKTGLLSANLLESAGQGQAEERLILALDGFLTGAYSPADCAAHLLSWGSTSGCDALLGMLLAVEAF